jgi:hypothetical protein
VCVCVCVCVCDFFFWGGGCALSHEFTLPNTRYGLQDRFLGLWLIDQSRHPWHSGGGPLFDAIVTDPPYGIREGARKVAAAPPPQLPAADAKPPSASYWRQHDTDGYEADTVFADLLDFSAQFLCMGGRLVYWLPVIPATYTDEQVCTCRIVRDFSFNMFRFSGISPLALQRPHAHSTHVTLFFLAVSFLNAHFALKPNLTHQVPRHACLEIVANSEQPLSKYARRLITMEKTRHWDPTVGASSSGAPTLNNTFRSHVMAPREPESPATGPPARRLSELGGFTLMSGAVADTAWHAVQAWIEDSGQLRPERVGVRRARFGPLIAADVDGGEGVAEADGGLDSARRLMLALGVPPRAGMRCVVSEYQRWQGVDYTAPFDGLDGATEVTAFTFGDTRSLRFRDGPLPRGRDDGQEQQRYLVDVGHRDRFELRGPVLDRWEHSLAPGAATFIVVSFGN